jgi:hypothetical protein
MAVKNGCAKTDNIAAKGNNGNGAVVADKTPTNSSSQSTPKPSFMTSIDNTVNRFTDAVEGAAAAIDVGTSKLNAVDCSDMLFDFIKENVPLFGTAMGGLDKVKNAMNGLTSGAYISKLIQEPDFVKNICSFIENWGGMIDGWLDVFIKTAFALFNKIDAARTRLEDASLSITEAVRHCILDVFNAMRDKIMDTINFSISINWDDLLRHMHNCPCICKIIANLTGCTKDENGRDITTNAAAVKYCLEQKFSLLTPVGLSIAIDNLLTKYVRRYIDLALNYIESWIVYVFKLLIKPFRWLLKKYVSMLRSKMDVTEFIEGLGPFECLFVYSKEYDNGKEFLGMSVIDMINTYRGWIKCFEVACPALSEKIKNKTKQLYKDLRLDDKYWRRAMEADIYTCCIAVDLDGMTPRESVLRQLYTESPFELLITWFRKLKNQDDNTSADVEESEEYDLNRPITASDMMPDDDNQTPSSFSDAINFTYSPETENSVNVGTKKITTRSENILKSIADSMVAGSKSDSYYTEKMYQLVRFGNKYATSKDYVLHMTNSIDQIERPGSDFSSNTTSARTLEYVGRQPDFVNDPTGMPTVDNPNAPEPVHPTYEVPNDFDKERSEKISSYKFTVRLPNESLQSYYKRMYSAALA